MFKPGTLVKLAAGYDKHVGFIFTTGLKDQVIIMPTNFWFDKSHIGLMIEEHQNDNSFVHVLVEDQVIIMPTRALQKY